jgi:cobalt-zinc-cadmium efflux system protein
MLSTPSTIEIDDIIIRINKLSTVKNIHHIHIWQLNEDEVHLGAEIDFDKDITLSEFDKILVQVEDILYSEFGINHINIQSEFNKKIIKTLYFNINDNRNSPFFKTLLNTGL